MRSLLPAMLFLLLPLSAAATSFRLPVTDCGASGGCYVTAYYDLNRTSGAERDWTCGGHTYDNHSGTDFGIGGFAGMDANGSRPIVAAAPGTVIATNDGLYDRNTSASGSNCEASVSCGNYVKVQHADKVTLYCHMKRGSVAVSNGQTVGCGQELGRVGSSGCSTGPHCHFGVYVGGSHDDPFGANAGCGGQTSYWVSQGAYRGLPAESCECNASCAGKQCGDDGCGGSCGSCGAGTSCSGNQCVCNSSTESCNRQDDDCDGQVDEEEVCGTGPHRCINIAGEFGFNCAGTLPSMTCVNITESQEIPEWADNYYCSTSNLGMVWSPAGPVAGYDCTQIAEGSEPASTTWTDNYLCVLPGAPYSFAWSCAGPIGGDCVRWYEPADPHTWEDNFMCASRKDPNGCLWRTGGFAFNCGGPVDGMDCVQLAMDEDTESWGDNYFCSEQKIGLKWSAHGPIPGMKCTQVTESVEPAEQGWGDNYVCLPEGAPYELTWSSSGPLPSGGCVGWNEILDPDAWSDNFMCARPTDANACLWKEGGLAFNCAGAVEGMSCVNVNEPADADGWADNYFCSDEDLGLQWSYEGPIDGMNCVQITEGSEGETEGWGDNYLCVSASAHVRLSWSSGGSPGIGTCIRWYEPADAVQTWTDNWLCVEREEICNGVDDDRDGQVDEDGVCPDAGTVTEDDGGTASGDGGSSAGQDGSVASGVPAVEVAGGCGCSSSQRGPELSVLLLGMVLLARSRLARRRAGL